MCLNYQNCPQLTPERVPKYKKLSAITVTPARVPKYKTCPQIMPESVIKKITKLVSLTTEMTKTSKVNHKEVSENSVIYHIVRATLSD